MKRIIIAMGFILTAGISISRAEEIGNRPLDTRVDIAKISAVDVSVPKPEDRAAAGLSLRIVEFQPAPLEISKAAGDTRSVRLDCVNSPGSKLCWQFTTIKDSFVVSCSGNYCTALWDKASRMLEDISSAYMSLQVKSAGEDIGRSAYKVTQKICGYSISDVDIGSDMERALNAFALSVNVAMPALVDIQEKAGLETVKKCKWVIR